MTIFHDLPRKSPAQAVAIALGMFDGLHTGHMSVLNALMGSIGKTAATPCEQENPANTRSGLAACVFTFSVSNERPDSKTYGHVLSERSRDAILECLGIDYVFEPEFSDFRDMSPEEFAGDFLGKYLNAKLVFCGEDFRFGKNAAASADDLKRLLPNGTRAEIVPLVRDNYGVVSTTRIRSLVQAGDMQGAAGLLGRAFLIDFTVEHGRRLGRGLGVPTINQALPDDFIRPCFGVYASVTVIGGKRYTSVTNVGVKPTVGSDKVLAETYIEDFSGDLYGQNVPVELVGFIRGEQKFESVEALFARIKEDILISHEINRCKD